MTEKKITKRENFTAIKEILLDKGFNELADVMDYEIELLNRKNASRASKPSARQVENISIGEKVLETLERDRPYTITEIIKVMDIDDMSTPRMSSICNKLEKEGKMKKTVEKRKSYFLIA